MNKKKRLFAIALMLLLIGVVSATDLSFTTFFPECSDTATSTIEGGLRCGAYFLVPNFHFEAGWNLLLGGISNAMYSVGEHVVNTATAPISDVNKDLSNVDVIEYFKTGLWDIVSIVFLPLTTGVIAIPIFIYAIISSVVAYALLITFEFVKTYLVIAVSWLVWSEVIFHESRDFPLDFRTSAIALTGLMVLGSIALLAADITIWGVI